MSKNQGAMLMSVRVVGVGHVRCRSADSGGACYSCGEGECVMRQTFLRCVTGRHNESQAAGTD